MFVFRQKNKILFLLIIFFSHHKRASTDLQPLPDAVHGILSAEDYVPAKLNNLFSPSAYYAFDIGRLAGKVIK